ncbi:MAG: hypothetical protein HS111_29740 [Kofleriaceae bacterium]|nr:hypothetical protein [Kofleriaceae bacterium]
MGRCLAILRPHIPDDDAARYLHALVELRDELERLVAAAAAREPGAPDPDGPEDVGAAGARTVRAELAATLARLERRWGGAPFDLPDHAETDADRAHLAALVLRDAVPPRTDAGAAETAPAPGGDGEPSTPALGSDAEPSAAG